MTAQHTRGNQPMELRHDAQTTLLIALAAAVVAAFSPARPGRRPSWQRRSTGSSTGTVVSKTAPPARSGCVTTRAERSASTSTATRASSVSPDSPVSRSAPRTSRQRRAAQRPLDRGRGGAFGSRRRTTAAAMTTTAATTISPAPSRRRAAARQRPAARPARRSAVGRGRSARGPEQPVVHGVRVNDQALGARA